MIILAHSLQGKSATYMVQPSTLAEFLFMMAFISAWHTYMYFVSNLDKERQVKEPPKSACNTHSLKFSPRAAFHQDTLWKDSNAYKQSLKQIRVKSQRLPGKSIVPNAYNSLVTINNTRTHLDRDPPFSAEMCLPGLLGPYSSWRKGRTLQGSTRTTPGILPGAVLGKTH